MAGRDGGLAVRDFGANRIGNRFRLIAACLAMLFAFTPGIASANANRPALWFDVGERLLYDIYWGFIHVGTTEVTTEWVEEEGQPLRIRISYRTRSNSVIEKIYPVDDTLESVIDAATFLPVSFRKIQNEGSYHSDEMTTFDHAAGTMRWQSFLNDNEAEYPIEPDTRDLITIMYYFRSMTFYIGQQLEFRVMADEKIYDLFVRVDALEEIDLEHYGKVPSYRFEPEAAFQGLFVRSGKVTFWVADDDRKLCTQIKAKVPVASVKLKLREVSGPGDDRWITDLEAKKDEPDRPFAGRAGRRR